MQKYFNKNKILILIFILLNIFIYANLFSKYKTEILSIPENKKGGISVAFVEESKVQEKSEVVDVFQKLLSKTPLGQMKERDTLLAMLDPKDSKTIFKVINTIQLDKNLRQNCHDIAHDIGHEAYKMYGFSGSMNFKNGSSLSSASVQDICAGGFVHGLLEEAAESLPDFEKDFNLLCDTVEIKEKDSCYHGVGHALMFLYKRNTELSVETCKKTNEQRYVNRCFEGVWMELFWGGANNPEQDIISLGWDKNNPLDPCINTETIAKPACFIYSAFGYLRFHKKDYTSLIKLCTESNLNSDDSGFCLKGLGIAISHNYSSDNIGNSQHIIKGKSKIEKEFFYAGMFGYAQLSGINKKDLTNSCIQFENKEDKNICYDIVKAL